MMNNTYWAPNRIENRLYRISSPTLQNLPAAGTQGTIRYNEPLKQIRSYTYLVEVLQEQLNSAAQHQYPLCFAFGEVRVECDSEHELSSIVYAVAGTINANLRPYDVVLRYRERNLAILLPGATADGGRFAMQRVTSQLSDGLHVAGKRYSDLVPAFGYAATGIGQFRSAATLLNFAEQALSTPADPQTRFERMFV